MRNVASNTHNTPNAQPMNDVHVRIKQVYVDPRTGQTVRVYQSGMLVSAEDVSSAQKGNNTDRYAVSIPLANARVQRVVDGELITNELRPLAFAHPDTNHHGARVCTMEWTLTINGVPYKAYDRKRNYERRVRDLKNVCDRILRARK